MSRAPQPDQHVRPVDPPAARTDSDELPTLKGQPGVIAYARSLGFGGCTARYVREESRYGSLPVFRIANAYFYSRADVRRWLLSKRVDPQQDRPAPRGATRQ